MILNVNELFVKLYLKGMLLLFVLFVLIGVLGLIKFSVVLKFGVVVFEEDDVIFVFINYLLFVYFFLRWKILFFVICELVLFERWRLGLLLLLFKFIGMIFVNVVWIEFKLVLFNELKLIVL